VIIIISPYSKKLRSGVSPNPKDYPYWNELIKLILVKFPETKIIQVGIDGEEKLENTETKFNLPLKELKTLINECDIWISVDNFFHHLGSYMGKKGIVLFGQSDPKIFGNSNNINLLRDRKYLRENQFDFWENAKLIPKSFVSPENVLKVLEKFFIKNK
jgi:ADP-heptose:LPS heptosyltransferase